VCPRDICARDEVAKLLGKILAPHKINWADSDTHCHWGGLFGGGAKNLHALDIPIVLRGLSSGEEKGTKLAIV